jgi:hypothetical protein
MRTQQLLDIVSILQSLLRPHRLCRATLNNNTADVLDDDYSRLKTYNMQWIS